jgi:DNA repair protein RadA/Sms
VRPGGAGASAVPLGQLDGAGSEPRPTGVAELDRVLCGGLVPGSVTLLGGEPGIGKSTLILQAVAGLATARNGRGCGTGAVLLVAAEESAEQVKRRADRLGLEQAVGGQGRAVGGQGGAVGGQHGSAGGPDGAAVWALAETELPALEAAVADLQPSLVVVDSIQAVRDPQLASVPGSVAQVRGCAQALADLARRSGTAVILVGHVTKDGSLAGPRALEHLVDTVLVFEGDRHQSLRLLRAVKHRFGATGELGVFEMTDSGLAGVADAGSLFLADRRAGASGSVVFPAIEGHRPLLVELQALVAPSALAAPRRSASGLDGARLALLIAVLEQRAGVKVTRSDVFASVVGGVRVTEPGADLALCLALASSTLGRPVPDDLVAVGEVGLAGELRQVGHLSRRLAEADRLGFRRALLPASAPTGGPVAELRAATLDDAVRLAFERRDGAGAGCRLDVLAAG